MKIANWNVNSLRVRLPQVLQWLEDNQADVLCLQELKMTNQEFPVTALLDAGYHCAFNGQKTYNGVAIISKQVLSDIETELLDYHDPQRRVISGTIDGVRIVNVYVPNGQALDSDKFQYKRQWFAALQKTMHKHIQQSDNVVLLGDFNITPSDADVHDPSKWQGGIHCSDIERLMLQKLMSLGLYDTFRKFSDATDAFSWWDYRGGGYRQNEGLRIDLILSSSTMLKRAKSCLIDETPRKLERPSDHTPVIAEYLMN